MESYEDRFEMCELASKKDGRIKVFDYEKKKDLAGETYNLMKKLLNDKDYENYEFSFIIGLDNANSFDKWVNFEELERLTSFVIVPRKGYKIKNNSWYFEKPHILLNDELEEIPIMEISSTQVRSMLERYRNSMDSEIYLDIKNTLLSSIDEDVFNYIINNKLYE
jgi:nicotinate-nucleotide adenylyltransferase